jgi:protein-S-isoprenylcysteine O-methyltransferase Ste14
MRYRQVYRVVNFTILGACLLVISLMLTPGLGWIGFVLPWLLVAAAYLLVTVALDVIIERLQRVAAARGQVERD